jgi:ribosomal protein S18 acetylase RimI-like enzyme
MLVRDAVAADAATIHEMLLAIARHVGHERDVVSTADDIARHGFGPDAAFEAVIAEDGGSPIGMCLFFRSFSTWRGTPGGYVQDLYVAPAARGSGAAAALVGAAAARVRARGGTYLRLSVDAANVSAQRFYERIGMIWSDSERILVADGAAFDALAEVVPDSATDSALGAAAQPVAPDARTG